MRAASAGRHGCGGRNDLGGHFVGYAENDLRGLFLEMPPSAMRRIAMPDEGIESLYGSFDENLRHLESALNVRLKTSGNDVVIEGAADDVGRAERVLEQLATLLRSGHRFQRGDVKAAAQLVTQDPNVELHEYFTKGSARAAGRRQVTPKSINQ